LRGGRDSNPRPPA